MTYEDGAVLLEATTPSIGVGGTFGVTVQSRLRNPLRGPMYVDEVRFNVDPSATANSEVVADLRVKLKLGRTEITNGHVPIWNLCLGTNFAPRVTVGETTTLVQANSVIFTWKLPKPLWIPEGEWLEPTFYNTGVYANAAQTVRVAYAGRALDPRRPVPQFVPVPWATAFVGAAKALAADTSEQSRENHLVNPHNVQLNVQRFIGRLAQDGGSTRFEYAGVEARDAAFQHCLINMVDSTGKNVVRDRTPFAEVFSIKDRAWTVNARLPPKGFYLAYFNENYSTLTGNAIQVFLSMIGYRDMPYRDLLGG